MFHPTTFEYLKPSDDQIERMAMLREAFASFAGILIANVPDGPDKTYLMRQIRQCAMWANVAVTREADGSPRPAGEMP